MNEELKPIDNDKINKTLLFWLSFAAALSTGFVMGIISYFLIEIMLF